MPGPEPSPPSFERLVGELSGPLFGYLCKMLGNRADADDLLQEALMRIARGLPNLKEGAAVKSWAYRDGNRGRRCHCFPNSLSNRNRRGSAGF